MGKVPGISCHKIQAMDLGSRGYEPVGLGTHLSRIGEVSTQGSRQVENLQSDRKNTHGGLHEAGDPFLDPRIGA